MKKEKFGNKKDIAIVNGVTSLRFIGSFLVIPIFKVMGGLSAALFSTIFMLTDCIDGFLARKLKSSTFFGALFDGITDKTFGIISFLILMSINPIAFSIPILLEASILLVQKKKFNNGKNIQSNKIGKLKTWFLGLSIIGSFGAVELLNMKTISEYIKYGSLNIVANIENTLTLLGIELPMIITQILTLKSYIKEAEPNKLDEEKEVINNENNSKYENETQINETIQELENISKEKEELKEKYTKLEKMKILMNTMFDPEYYSQNKDMPIKKLTKDLFKK